MYWNYDLEDGAHEVSFKLLNRRHNVNIKADKVIYYVKDDTPVVPTLQPIIFNKWGDGFNNGTSLDFDNDGIHDLFICGGNIGGRVLQGQGLATRNAYREVAAKGDIGNVDFIASAFPVDFNADGYMDIVAFDSEPSGHTDDDGGPEGIFLGDGAGKFTIAPTTVYESDGTTIDESFNWTWIKSGDVADFNNDGRLDLVVCSDKEGYNCILVNGGTDSAGKTKFTKQSYDTTAKYTIVNSSWDNCMGYVKAYDMNSDGYMDFFHHLAKLGENCSRMFRKLEWYDSTVELPFENITVTVPSGYKDILTTQYGDWHTEIKGTSMHGYPFYKSQMEYFKYLGKM